MGRSDLHNQTMKQLLKKFSSSELFVLPEAASYLKVSEKYLAQLIKSGKLRAFKVDNHWFIEEKWLLDFKKNIHQHLKIEKDNHYLINNKKQPWTKTIIKKEIKPGSFHWFNPFLWLSYSFLLAAIMIGLAYLIIPFGQVENNKYQLAGLFLTGVDRAYSWPLDLVAWRPAQGAINDEVLTERINEIWKGREHQGEVAGVSEKAVEPVKIKRRGWPR